MAFKSTKLIMDSLADTWRSRAGSYRPWQAPDFIKKGQTLDEYNSEYQKEISKKPEDRLAAPDKMILLGNSYYFGCMFQKVYTEINRSRVDSIFINLNSDYGMTQTPSQANPKRELDGYLYTNYIKLGDQVNG